MWDFIGIFISVLLLFVFFFYWTKSHFNEKDRDSKDLLTEEKEVFEMCVEKNFGFRLNKTFCVFDETFHAQKTFTATHSVAEPLPVTSHLAFQRQNSVATPLGQHDS